MIFLFVPLKINIFHPNHKKKKQAKSANMHRRLIRPGMLPCRPFIDKFEFQKLNQ